MSEGVGKQELRSEGDSDQMVGNFPVTLLFNPNKMGDEVEVLSEEETGSALCFKRTPE